VGIEESLNGLYTVLKIESSCGGIVIVLCQYDRLERSVSHISIFLETRDLLDGADDRLHAELRQL
jgi:hypothetical protein